MGLSVLLCKAITFVHLSLVLPRPIAMLLPKPRKNIANDITHIALA
jgi:hypothetical protein